MFKPTHTAVVHLPLDYSVPGRAKKQGHTIYLLEDKDSSYFVDAEGWMYTRGYLRDIKSIEGIVSIDRVEGLKEPEEAIEKPTSVISQSDEKLYADRPVLSPANASRDRIENTLMVIREARDCLRDSYLVDDSRSYLQSLIIKKFKEIE